MRELAVALVLWLSFNLAVVLALALLVALEGACKHPRPTLPVAQDRSGEAAG